jgi:isochorismate synthase
MTAETSIRLRCKAALSYGWSVALCRLPDSEVITQFYANTHPELKKIDLQKTEGLQYAFAPYASGNLSYIITPDCIAENETITFGSLELSNTDDNHDILWHTAENTNTAAGKKQYMDYVNAAKRAIEKGELAKTVAARSKQIEKPESFHLLDHFFALCKQNPGAHVYLFSSPVSGTWIGSTPELLLSFDKKRIATVALAGTKQIEDESEWSQKEKDEHGFVEAFIDDAFEQLKIDAVRLSDITETKAGSVKHLFSTFEWCAAEDELRSKFHKLLGLINPTPAVCGLPMMEASLFIAQHEHMERRFYSGFNGIISKNDTRLFVTLRCYEFFRNGVMLYAGAGITADSDAEAEWEETERKMKSFFNFT